MMQIANVRSIPNERFDDVCKWFEVEVLPYSSKVTKSCPKCGAKIIHGEFKYQCGSEASRVIRPKTLDSPALDIVLLTRSPECESNELRMKQERLRG
jgi:ribosomal protein S27AE